MVGDAAPGAVATFSLAAADFDDDGDLDLFANQHHTHPSRLLRNEGHWHFRDATRAAGVVEAAAVGGLYGEGARTIEDASLVVVSARDPRDGLYQELIADPDRLAQAGIRSVTAIGDCYAPGTIAAAVYSGHRFARELGRELPEDVVPFRREFVELSPDY